MAEAAGVTVFACLVVGGLLMHRAAVQGRPQLALLGKQQVNVPAAQAH